MVFLRASRAFCSAAILAPRLENANSARLRRGSARRPTVHVAATGSGDGGDNLDELFKRELERRQIASVDDIPDQPSTSAGGAAPGQSPFQRRAPTPPPSFAGQGDDVPPQLQKSRELNSEGLEGLIPRATALVQLGASFFLAFGPFIAGVVLAFWAIYAVFGENFVHSGAASYAPPPRYDPLELLNEPTVDPMIPM